MGSVERLVGTGLPGVFHPAWGIQASVEMQLMVGQVVVVVVVIQIRGDTSVPRIHGHGKRGFGQQQSETADHGHELEPEGDEEGTQDDEPDYHYGEGPSVPSPSPFKNEMGFFEQSFPWISVLFHLVSLQNTNWCDTRWECNGSKHTMCQYRMVAKPDSSCIGTVDSSLTGLRERILGMHNYVRNQIAAGTAPGWPEAANMRQMTWDNTLAQVALMWAFQCVSREHDSCRKTQQFNDVGQNWGVASTTEHFPNDGDFQIFNSWIKEISRAPGKIASKFKPNPKYEHFPQLVWARTYKVGCGMVNYTSVEPGVKLFRQVMVCNYGPSGNEVGKRMWAKGQPCEKCPENTACRKNSTYPNLCAAPGEPADEEPVAIDIPAGQSCIVDSVTVAVLTLSLVLQTSITL